MNTNAKVCKAMQLGSIQVHMYTVLTCECAKIAWPAPKMGVSSSGQNRLEAEGIALLLSSGPCK